MDLPFTEVLLTFTRLCLSICFVTDRDQGQTRWSAVPQFFIEPFLYLGAMLAVYESYDIVAVMMFQALASSSAISH